MSPSACALWLVLGAIGCGNGETTPAADAGPRYAHDVYVEGRTLRDAAGRELLFRGYNAKVSGVFDVTFDDGRAPNETFPGFDEASAKRFEELGFDVLRLPVSWSGLEPHPLQYSEAFLQKIDAVLAMAKAHHFHVFIDMHQDAYSKEIGEDGAPLWAIVPPPPMLLSGPSDDSRRLSGPVLAAGFSFFENAPATDGRPLQDAFIAAVSVMVKRYLGNPTVLGYEDFNEPIVLVPHQLDDFHAKFADALHAIDPDMPLLFEPLATRNQTDAAAIPSAPWSHGPAIYAPHIYTGQFSVPSQNAWESEDPAKLAPSMTAAEKEAEAWGTPLFVTEYGCSQALARGPVWLGDEIDLQDQHLASSTAWAWEPGDWGFVDATKMEWPATRRAVSRPYPRAVAGDLLSIARPSAAELVVHYRASAKTVGLANEVSASADDITGVIVSCDGKPATPTVAIGRVSFVCPGGEGEHTFTLTGTPAP